MIGQKLGSFRIEAELGSGAMGIVYLGRNEAKNRPAAIKVISAEQMGKGKSFERFLREAAILEQFRHPNIVRYLARGKSAGIHYYAMEYITGPTMDKVLRDQGSMPWREVVTLGVQLCDALHYAHEHGVVHRDLKPSNLMVTEQGQLKLTDFGIAKDLDATALTGTGRTLGTAAYMAPEQIRGTPDISHKTDLYALGAVFYQMLTGDPPFSGTTAVVLMHAHINEPAKRPSAKVQEIPKALDDLVVNLMAKAPSDRPWDAEAVAQKLRELQAKVEKQETIKMVWPEPNTLASMPTRAEVVDPIAKKSSKSRKNNKSAAARKARLEVAGLVSGLVLVAGVIGYLLWPPSARYYFTKAETLMASKDPYEWIRARDEYLDPLDRKFPNHPYRESTEAWRDRLDLRDAQRRADILEKVNLTAISKPKDEAEETYQVTFQEAAEALKIHHDRGAEELWRNMERQLTREGRENRGWVLIARSKADAVAKEIHRRRQTVTDLLGRATIPEPLMNSEVARKDSLVTLRSIVARFDAYPDVADLVAQAKTALTVEEPKATPPTPEPEAQGGKTESPAPKP